LRPGEVGGIIDKHLTGAIARAIVKYRVPLAAG
jgi:hypothetical protein